MRPAGEVVRTAQGLVILRVAPETTPRIGVELVDDGLEEVGRVVDVFGPVSRPYVAVSPGPSVDPPLLVGERLYEREAA